MTFFHHQSLIFPHHKCIMGLTSQQINSSPRRGFDSCLLTLSARCLTDRVGGNRGRTDNVTTPFRCLPPGVAQMNWKRAKTRCESTRPLTFQYHGCSVAIGKHGHFWNGSRPQNNLRTPTAPRPAECERERSDLLQAVSLTRWRLEAPGRKSQFLSTSHKNQEHFVVLRHQSFFCFQSMFGHKWENLMPVLVTQVLLFTVVLNLTTLVKLFEEMWGDPPPPPFSSISESYIQFSFLLFTSLTHMRWIQRI